MKIETFDLERIQSLWENTVKYNLTESGLHPYTVKELLDAQEIDRLLDLRLGYGQTNGSDELRTAVSRLYPGADLDNVLVTNGSSEANLIVTWSHLEPDDELVLMLPNYMQIWGIARSFGVTVKPFHLKEELRWSPDLNELKDQITPRTKMIALCNPNNPTGAVLNESDMNEIVNLARQTDAWIFSDEIYRGAELDGRETPSFWGFYDKVIVNGGLAKAYGLPGIRIGWLVGPKNEIEKSWSYRDYTSICCGILSQRLATLVLQPEMRKKVLSRGRKMINENLAELKKWVEKHADLFHFIPPRAGAIVFMRYRLNINSRDLSNMLREQKSVFVLDGDCFGMDHYLRIGIGSEKDYFLTGLNLIEEMLMEIGAGRTEKSRY
ncbi:MAG: hypothetical protein AMJ79_02920 [Phycisphaerae bacterium SM23_30]|nr:MAG: hypothetical protein AMJ79_02920 [Phycisphaerae bacterium SM23_30]